MTLEHVFINGIDGNMGRRYAAILRSLDIEVSGADKNHLDLAGMKKADGYIIATPTSMHLSDIRRFVKFGKPILVEKPFTRDYQEFLDFVDEHANKAGLISVVNQYQNMIEPGHSGKSIYNYYKSGNDGLYYDCFNIIGLSNEFPELSTESPIWRVMINGQRLSIADMDFAYVKMIAAWCKNPHQTNWNYAVQTQHKIFDFLGNKK